MLGGERGVGGEGKAYQTKGIGVFVLGAYIHRGKLASTRFSSYFLRLCTDQMDVGYKRNTQGLIRSG